MQKVEGSSPFIRLLRSPRSGGGFLLSGTGDARRLLSAGHRSSVTTVTEPTHNEESEYA